MNPAGVKFKAFRRLRNLPQDRQLWGFSYLWELWGVFVVLHTWACPENLIYLKVTLVQHHPANVDGPLYFPSSFDYESFPVCKNAEG